jgi:hypothetical protein
MRLWTPSAPPPMVLGIGCGLASASRTSSSSEKVPTLGEWSRVFEYRSLQLKKLDNVEVYRESKMTVDDILELGVPHVVLATGAS